ncbi:MAG: DUF2726 domain-containing protein [Clostridiales bacterium]|nr:DUF2726 domain-containing protein [Clostridiales bacterium]
MEWAIVAVLVIVILVLTADKAKSKKQPASIKEPKELINYANGYKSKWMFSYNEKDAFNKIKAITDELGLYLFAKVRLFDLIEPKEQAKNKTAHQWKIQAKHVDFVICDQKLVARLIIELDDSSHNTKPREERDNFVDNVLLNCGYKILHIRSVEPNKLRAQLESVFKTASSNS